MVAIEVKLEKLKEEYPSFYNYFKKCLNSSDSKFKDYKEKKYKCFYYVGFYMMPSEKTEDYYDHLYSLTFDERVAEELNKTRVTITIVANKFAMSDQVDGVSKTLIPIVEEIVVRKMVTEQATADEPNEDVIDSIPDYEGVVEKMKDEENTQHDFLENLGLDDMINVQGEVDEMKPEVLLKKLISEEKYEEANKLLDEHPELRKKDEEDPLK